MKKTHTKLNIAWLMIVFIIAFCTSGLAYSYFTSTSKTDGELLFSSLKVNFGYTDGVLPHTIETNEFVIYPSTDSIFRGEQFTFKVLTDETNNTFADVQQLMFVSSVGSCESYIRYKVNAYIVNPDGEADLSVNYGRYFIPTTSNSTKSELITITEPATTEGAAPIVVEQNYIYFLNQKLDKDSNRNFMSAMTLDENAPEEILSSTMRVTITFEAVQASSKAFKSVFNDAWGWLESWT